MWEVWLYLVIEEDKGRYALNSYNSQLSPKNRFSLNKVMRTSNTSNDKTFANQNTFKDYTI
jgi:hypothetical protein